MNSKQYSIEIGGKTLIAEFNNLAEQAHGSVMLKYGNTVVLATAVMGKTQRDVDFFPLTVEYEERFYASGKILGSRFIRREGKPSDEAILSGRIVDRTIRPLFDHNIRNEVQVVLTVLSIDEDDPDVISVIGASLALGTSDIPWNGPVSAIRIGHNNGFHINPSYSERKKSDISLELLACGKDGNINMIELAGNQCNEKEVGDALQKASDEIEKIQKWQENIIRDIGKTKKIIKNEPVSSIIIDLFNKEIEPSLKQAIFNTENSEKNFNSIKERWEKLFEANHPEESISRARDYLEEKINKIVHDEAIDNNKRVDGRGMDEIRPLYVKAGGISPVLHGSGTFYRGQTHVLSVLTLGGPGDAQVLDGMEITQNKRFMHHYNFPPFSTGETGRIGGTNRRMIGHGALAEKALLPVIPPKEVFPYTIRLVSEAFSSNGSTSMGSVCGSTIALMDGGVPIIAPVAGIASGLMMREAKAGIVDKIFGNKKYEYKILTDIQGPEDHHGDMDFKVAGTRNGITAVQMDVKVNGVPIPILIEAFEKAKLARIKILDTIEKEIAKPRQDISNNAPKIVLVKINKEKIGLVIGTGGKTIKEIKEKTGIDDINIEDDGSVFITGKNGSAEKAKEIIKIITTDRVGEKPNPRYNNRDERRTSS